MKKLIIVIVILLIASVSYAGKMRWAVGITGGGDALDGIISPASGDTTMVFTSITGTASGTLYIYYALTSALTESSPDIITPDTNANGVKWFLIRKFASVPSGDGFMTEVSSIPMLVSKGSYTSALLGVDSNGTMGLYTNVTFSPLIVPNGTTLPSTCAIGSLFSDTDATNNCKLYLCEATDTWRAVGCP